MPLKFQPKSFLVNDPKTEFSAYDIDILQASGKAFASKATVSAINFAEVSGSDKLSVEMDIQFTAYGEDGSARIHMNVPVNFSEDSLSAVKERVFAVLTGIFIPFPENNQQTQP